MKIEISEITIDIAAVTNVVFAIFGTKLIISYSLDIILECLGVNTEKYSISGNVYNENISLPCAREPEINDSPIGNNESLGILNSDTVRHDLMNMVDRSDGDVSKDKKEDPTDPVEDDMEKIFDIKDYDVSVNVTITHNRSWKLIV